MFAHRLAWNCGTWDVDGLMEMIPVSVFEELQVAFTLMDDFEDWRRTPSRREKDYKPPEFGPKVKVRRRLSGEPY